MSNKELTSLAIRVFAIYVLVQTVILIGQSGSSWHAYFQGQYSKWLFIILALSISGLIAVFFVLWKLSHSVFKKVSTANKMQDGYKVDQIFILQLIGFYLIMLALLGLAQSSISMYYIYIQQANEYGYTYNFEMKQQTIVYIIESALKLIIGITLVIRASGWTVLINRFRNLGLTKKL